MSNQWLSKVAIFAVGAAIGSAVTWKLLKTKYERLADEEIESVKEAFFEREAEEKQEQEAKKEYERIMSSYAPSAYKPEPIKTETVLPYVISPEQYGEGDYEMIGLTYYADKVLADFNDDIINDIEAVVGPDAINSFGEFQDDVIHVRDEEQKIDYEIVCDPRNYYDVVDKSTPFLETE